MAGETILVVDDSAVNRKLAVVLRSDGYRVLLSSTAEQAQMSMRTTIPGLLL